MSLASTNSNANNTHNTANKSTTNSTTNAEDKKESLDPNLESTHNVNAENGESERANDGAIFIGQKPDSTNINSVSKFNFIFYFIYKLKYDEDPNGIGHMSYEF